MKDIEILYNCIFDESYKNSVELQIILNSISDKSLVRGFLIELIAKSEYEADVNVLTNIFGEYHDGNSDKWFDEHKYFTSQAKEVNVKTRKENSIHLTLLKTLKTIWENCKEGDWPNYDSYEKELSLLTKDELLEFKNYLIGEELFEAIASVDKYLV